MINGERLLSLLQGLISTKSVNPSLVAMATVASCQVHWRLHAVFGLGVTVRSWVNLG